MVCYGISGVVNDYRHLTTYNSLDSKPFLDRVSFDLVQRTNSTPLFQSFVNIRRLNQG